MTTTSIKSFIMQEDDYRELVKNMVQSRAYLEDKFIYRVIMEELIQLLWGLLLFFVLGLLVWESTLMVDAKNKRRRR